MSTDTLVNCSESNMTSASGVDILGYKPLVRIIAYNSKKMIRDK